MNSRLNPYDAAPEAMKALVALQQSGLDYSLIDLVKTHASQMNGCAYCIDMHTREPRARGETEERSYLLDALRESPLYSERKRTALACIEAVTLLSETHVPDRVYDQAREQFSEAEVNLTLCVAAINAWIGLRSASGRFIRRIGGAQPGDQNAAFVGSRPEGYHRRRDLPLL